MSNKWRFRLFIYLVCLFVFFLFIVILSDRILPLHYKNIYFLTNNSKLYLIHTNNINTVKINSVTINQVKKFSVMKFYQKHTKNKGLPIPYEIDYDDIYYICNVNELNLNLHTYYSFNIETNKKPISGYIFFTLENIDKIGEKIFLIDYDNNNIPINNESNSIVCFTSTDYNQGIKIK